MAPVLIIATRYDDSTRMTYQWAKALENKLQNHAVKFLGGRDANNPLVTRLVDYFGYRSSHYEQGYVIFYGHGEPDRLIGQKGWLSFGSGPTLIDTSTVRIFQGCPVYTVCCHALNSLGAAYGSIFPATTYPNAGFIGYNNQLGISIDNATYFQEVIERSAIDLVNGVIAKQVCDNLRSAWEVLSNSLLVGDLRDNTDAFIAAAVANSNARTVGIQP